MPIPAPELWSAFDAFAGELNFTRAARRIGLSQPALFDRVQRLAGELGVVLYRREGRALTLTPEGKRTAAFARESLARAAAFARELRGEAARERATLAAGEGAYLYLLRPALAAYLASGAELDLLTLGGANACEALRSGRADLALAAIDVVPDDLVGREVHKTAMHVAMAARHPLARRRSVRLAELARERLVLPPEGRTHRDFVGRALASRGLELLPPVEADGWPLMLQFAALGLGVAIVNGICTAPKGVVLRRVPELGTIAYRLLRRRHGTLSPAAARLHEAIVARAGR
jgi:DNA-binding transcriptional LysR family regulator